MDLIPPVCWEVGSAQHPAASPAAWLCSLRHTNSQSIAAVYQAQLPIRLHLQKETPNRHVANTRFLVRSQNPYYFVRALAS